MSSSVPASEARATLPHLLDRVEAGEEIAVTRHGRTVAVIVSPSTLSARRAQAAFDAAAAIGKRLRDAREQPLPSGGLSRRRADELVREVRASRADR